MATSSFFQDVIVSDPEKIKEIKDALKSDNHAFAEIPPADSNSKEQREAIARLAVYINQDK